LPLLLAMAVVAVLLIREPHLSATVLIVLMCIILIFVGGASLKQLLTIGLIAVGAGLLIMFLMSGSYDYIGTRLRSWRDPFADILGETWQTCQSLIAIGSGGLFGLGLG